MNISQLRHSLKNQKEQEHNFLKNLLPNLTDLSYRLWESSYTYSSTYTFSEALLYCVDIAKDCRDIFRPYKTPHHLKKDLLYFFTGLKNVLAGITAGTIASFSYCGFALFNLASLPFYLVFSAFGAQPLTPLKKLAANLYYLTSSLIGAISQTFRGFIQIVSSPLVLLIAGVKSIWFRNMPWQPLIQKPRIKSTTITLDHLLKSQNTAYDSPEMEEALRTVYSKDKMHHSQIQKEIKDRTVTNHELLYRGLHEDIYRVTKTINPYQCSPGAKVHLFLNRHDANKFSVPMLHRTTIIDYLNNLSIFPEETTIWKNIFTPLCRKYAVEAPDELELIEHRHWREIMEQLSLQINLDNSGNPNDWLLFNESRKRLDDYFQHHSQGHDQLIDAHKKWRPA